MRVHSAPPAAHPAAMDRRAVMPTSRRGACLQTRTPHERRDHRRRGL